MDTDLNSLLISLLLEKFQELEQKVNLKEQSSLNVNLNILMPIKKGGTKLIIENPKPEQVPSIRILNLLGNIDVLLDFVCMVKQSKNKQEICNILKSLSSLYILLVKQQHLEEMYVLDKSYDIDLKKNSFLINIRRYFISSIKTFSQMGKKNDHQIVQAFAQLISKILARLEPNCNKLNHKFIDHVSNLFLAYNELFKRNGKMNPWVLFTIYEEKAYDNLFQYVVFFLKEFDDQKAPALSHLSLLFKNMIFTN